jgi:hypothetical protein
MNHRDLLAELEAATSTTQDMAEGSTEGAELQAGWRLLAGALRAADDQAGDDSNTFIENVLTSVTQAEQQPNTFMVALDHKRNTKRAQGVNWLPWLTVGLSLVLVAGLIAVQYGGKKSAPSQPPADELATTTPAPTFSPTETEGERESVEPVDSAPYASAALSMAADAELQWDDSVDEALAEMNEHLSAMHAGVWDQSLWAMEQSRRSIELEMSDSEL